MIRKIFWMLFGSAITLASAYGWGMWANRHHREYFHGVVEDVKKI